MSHTTENVICMFTGTPLTHETDDQIMQSLAETIVLTLNKTRRKFDYTNSLRQDLELIAMEFVERILETVEARNE